MFSGYLLRHIVLTKFYCLFVVADHKQTLSYLLVSELSSDIKVITHWLLVNIWCLVCSTFLTTKPNLEQHKAIGRLCALKVWIAQWHWYTLRSWSNRYENIDMTLGVTKVLNQKYVVWLQSKSQTVKMM